MAKNGRKQGNNNRSGSESPLMSGWMSNAKERPLATAAAVGGAVAAGVFLWSRRNQISDQLSNMSDQISEWSGNMRSQGDSGDFESAGTGSSFGSSISSAAGAGTGGMASSGLSGSTGTTSSGSNRASGSGRKAGSRGGSGASSSMSAPGGTTGTMQSGGTGGDSA